MNTSTNKWKWVVPTSLFILLILFPAISYWYLNKGFTYGKEVFAELTPKGHIDSLGYQIFPYDLRMKYFEDQCILLVDSEKNNAEEKYDRIVTQFGGNPRFNMVHWSDCAETDLRFENEDKDATEVYLCSPGPWKMESASALLFDRKGYLRYIYEGEDDQWVQMARHLAFMIPKKPKTSLSVKRK